MGTVERTNQAVLDAAIRTWARDSSASLGAIASAAGVGRTTLHRLHPDRAALVRAVDEELRTRFSKATTRAAIDDVDAMSALHRLCIEYLDLGDALRLVFADGTVVDPSTWDTGAASHQSLTGLFARGQRDGVFDPVLDPEWMVLTMWLMLCGAWMVMTETSVPRADAANLLMRTLAGAVARKPDDFGLPTPIRHAPSER